MKEAIAENWRYGVAFILALLIIPGVEPLTRLLPVTEVKQSAITGLIPSLPQITPTLPPIIPTISPDTALQTVDLSNVSVRRNFVVRPELNPVTFQGEPPNHGEFATYTVKQGDTPIKIASSFGIQPETLLGGNPSLSEEAGLLYVDTELLVLPIDGVLHDVELGDTLESVSNLYNVPQEEIIAYPSNNLTFPYRLYPDTQIVVPGAVREVFKWDPPKLVSTSSSEVGDDSGSALSSALSSALIGGTGTFLWPSIGYRITQVYWYGHPAIDVGLSTGSSIYASDTGTVTYAAWSPYCYGNLIVVNHGNGFETFYAHLSSFNVVPGQIVYQGNIIGYSGNTGCSTGPHLHFEIRADGARVNPCAWTGGC